MKYINQMLLLLFISWWSVPIACFCWLFAWMFEAKNTKESLEVIIKSHWIL